MQYQNMVNNIPPEGVPIMTKIDDEKGKRNETMLIYYKNMFWFRDMSMYVYYTPTHWRHLTEHELKLLNQSIF